LLRARQCDRAIEQYFKTIEMDLSFWPGASISGGTMNKRLCMKRPSSLARIKGKTAVAQQSGEP
jgi:hypothetical protein